MRFIIHQRNQEKQQQTVHLKISILILHGIIVMFIEFLFVFLKPNKNVTTNIPNDNYSKKLSKYEFLAFDYANTFHYIDIDNTIPDDNRIILKLQFRKGKTCEKLTRNWAQNTRDLLFI